MVADFEEYQGKVNSITNGIREVKKQRSTSN